MLHEFRHNKLFENQIEMRNTPWKLGDYTGVQSGASWVNCMFPPPEHPTFVLGHGGAGGDRIPGASFGLTWPLLTLPCSHDFSIWGLYPLADRTQ